MPRGQTRGEEAPAAAAPGQAVSTYVMPDDVRADLLRAQAEQITTAQRLPQVKIMAAGAGLFEFKDTDEAPTREFVGIILGSHARNVLWDRPFGSPPPAGVDADEAKKPACSSEDGTHGVPRAGFAHAALRGAVATGVERVACASCPYNQWASKGLIPALLRQNETAATAKGKAVTNQRSVYIMRPGQLLPVEMILPPTSLTDYDAYMASLLNNGLPSQAVVTTFKQEVVRMGTYMVGVTKFSRGELLTQEQFEQVLEVRQRHARTINPALREVLVEADAGDYEQEMANVAEQGTHEPASTTGDIPF